MLCKNIKDILNSTYGPKVQLKKGTQKGKKNDQGLKIDYIQGMTEKLRACLEGTTIDKKGMRRIKKFRIKQHISSRCSPQRLSREKIKSDKTFPVTQHIFCICYMEMKSSNVLLIVWKTREDTEWCGLYQKGLQLSCFIIFFILDIQNNCYCSLRWQTCSACNTWPLCSVQMGTESSSAEHTAIPFVSITTSSNIKAAQRSVPRVIFPPVFHGSAWSDLVSVLFIIFKTFHKWQCNKENESGFYWTNGILSHNSYTLYWQ